MLKGVSVHLTHFQDRIESKWRETEVFLCFWMWTNSALVPPPVCLSVLTTCSFLRLSVLHLWTKSSCFVPVPKSNSRFQESYFVFHLTPQQAQDIAMSRYVPPLCFQQAGRELILSVLPSAPVCLAPRLVLVPVHVLQKNIVLFMTLQPDMDNGVVLAEKTCGIFFLWLLSSEWSGTCSKGLKFWKKDLIN